MYIYMDITRYMWYWTKIHVFRNCFLCTRGRNAQKIYRPQKGNICIVEVLQGYKTILVYWERKSQCKKDAGRIFYECDRNQMIHWGNCVTYI